VRDVPEAGVYERLFRVVATAALMTEVGQLSKVPQHYSIDREVQALQGFGVEMALAVGLERTPNECGFLDTIETIEKDDDLFANPFSKLLVGFEPIDHRTPAIRGDFCQSSEELKEFACEDVVTNSPAGPPDSVQRSEDRNVLEYAGRKDGVEGKLYEVWC